jgi:anti-anti-sigma factor
MEIREFREGDVLVLAPNGSVAGSEETNAIETKLGTSLKAGFRLLVLDCAGIGQLASAAIRVLLTTSRKLDRTEGRLVLCGMNAKVQKAFSIAGFDKDFTVVATRDEALRRVLEPVNPPPARTPKPPPPKPAVGLEVVVPSVANAGKPPVAVPEVAEVAAEPAPVAKTSHVVPVEAPPRPDFQDALATAILDTLRARVPRHGAAGHAARSDLDGLAGRVLTALRAGLF